MKSYMLVCLGMLAIGQIPVSVVSANHPQFTMDSTLEAGPSHNEVMLDALVKIGSTNRLPIGFVTTKNTPLCRERSQVNANRITVSALINYINERYPDYRAGLDEGVLTIEPKDLSEKSRQLLNLKMDVFRSDATSQLMQGVNLWFTIRAYIAHEGTAFAGSVSTKNEVIPALNLKGVRVQEVLNRIAGAGQGGIWIMHSSLVNELSPKTPKPYDVYGYVGDPSASTIGCGPEEAVSEP